MKKTRVEKGITLIALIITIIILLILAVVTIGSIKNSNIITYAQKATNSHTIGEEKEKIGLAYSEYKIDKLNNPLATLQVKGASVSKDSTNGWIVVFETGNKYIISSTGDITKDEPIVYDPEKWKYAWTSDGTKWSEIIKKSELEEGSKVEGKIIAKIYETEEIIENFTLEGTTMDNIPTGKGYHLKIDTTEEVATLPPIMDIDSQKICGWTYEWVKYLSGETTDAIQPYITKVIIGKGITNIPKGAFANQGSLSLREVDIPNTVTTIGTAAFNQCELLEKITLPNGLSTIETSAFYGCISLKNINIPNTVTNIGAGAFQECKSLKNITLPNNLTKIENNVFDNCRALEKVIIPNSITAIGKEAFRWCEILPAIIIPSSVVTIEEEAFRDCRDMTEIYIESTSNEFNVGNYAFYGTAHPTIFVRSKDIADKLNNSDIIVDNTTIPTDYTWPTPII